MISPFIITAKDKDSKARAGVLYTTHGAVRTPVFMPVATQACVKALNDDDLRSVGAECVLSNTYHLYLRPGTEILKKMGGIHKFMCWDRSVLTDSGGFQVHSLSHLRKITEDGVWFKSHHDGSKHFFTPENVIDYQAAIASDIWTCLDVLMPNSAHKNDLKKALEITKRWAERAAAHYAKTVPEQKIEKSDNGFTVGNSLLFGIIQGSIYADLRADAAKHMAAQNVHGFCIGGLSVGETLAEMNAAVEAVIPHLPEEKPRYLMGLGTPEELLNCIERGVDMFDCVWPTRVARNGQAMTSGGKVNVKNTGHRASDKPLDENCDCMVCKKYSRAYLSHLYRANELTSHRLLSMHNIRFLTRTMERVRQAVYDGNFKEIKEEIIKKYI